MDPDNTPIASVKLKIRYIHVSHITCTSENLIYIIFSSSNVYLFK